MRKEKKHVVLTECNRDILLNLLKKGSLKARITKRIVSLLELDKGKSYRKASKIANLSEVSQGKLVKKYKKMGISCIYDAPRSGRPPETTSELEDKITVLACEEAPEGYSQWSLRLLADKAVELKYCEKISHTQVQKILQKKT